MDDRGKGELQVEGGRFDERLAGELSARLISDAGGDWELEAAARLVVEHGFWLGREDFGRFVMRSNDDEPDWVGIDWSSLADALNSDSVSGSHEELLVLKVATSICHRSDLPVWEIYNVKPVAMRAIMRALAHAAGYSSEVDEWCPLNGVR